MYFIDDPPKCHLVKLVHYWVRLMEGQCILHGFKFCYSNTKVVFPYQINNNEKRNIYLLSKKSRQGRVRFFFLTITFISL